MAGVCPQCRESGQVLRLAEFWKSLPYDAELKRELAQPPAYEWNWILLLALAGLTWVAYTAGDFKLAVALGVALLLVVGWVVRSYQLAEAARDWWDRALYCRRCPVTFAPEEALTV